MNSDGRAPRGGSRGARENIDEGAASVSHKARQPSRQKPQARHTAIVQIVDWDSMQHYKNRNPPWIRLYAELLDRPDFAHMSRADFGVYCTLSLLASKWDNAIPHNPDWLRKRFKVGARAIETLRDAGLIEIAPKSNVHFEQSATVQTASSLLADRLHSATSESEPEPESEPESEPEPEPEPEPESESEPDTPPADGGSAEGVARSRAPRRPVRRMPAAWVPTPELLDEIRAECHLVDIAAELRTIRDHEFKVAHTDWDATVRNWMRREQKQLAQRAASRAAPPRETKFNRMIRRQDEI